MGRQPRLPELGPALLSAHQGDRPSHCGRRGPCGTQESYAKLVRSIYYYHAVTRDWGDIAYNFLIDP